MSDWKQAIDLVTSDMTHIEFCQWVRDCCEMTLKNTPASVVGVYMQGLIERLLESSAEDERLRAENERLREALKCCEDIAGDAKEMAGFLMSDRGPGETTWKSPPISTGSSIDVIARKYTEGGDS